MKTIEVGMYVRTKKGIAKVIKIDDLDNVAWTDKKDIYFGVNRETGYLDWYIYDDGTVIKASHNIIDLIEVGDYVNGFPVEDYFHKYNEEKDIFENVGVITTECYLENSNFSWILAKDIKTILTHEQFENYCFRIGDK